jgi:hypothetical protein
MIIHMKIQTDMEVYHICSHTSMINHQTDLYFNVTQTDPEVS